MLLLIVYVMIYWIPLTNNVSFQSYNQYFDEIIYTKVNKSNTNVLNCNLTIIIFYRDKIVFQRSLKSILLNQCAMDIVVINAPFSYKFFFEKIQNNTNKRICLLFENMSTLELSIQTKFIMFLNGDSYPIDANHNWIYDTTLLLSKKGKIIGSKIIDNYGNILNAGYNVVVGYHNKFILYPIGQGMSYLNKENMVDCNVVAISPTSLMTYQKYFKHYNFSFQNPILNAFDFCLQVGDVIFKHDNIMQLGSKFENTNNYIKQKLEDTFYIKWKYKLHQIVKHNIELNISVEWDCKCYKCGGFSMDAIYMMTPLEGKITLKINWHDPYCD